MSGNISIFLASDNNYAPFLATTVASIAYSTKSSIDFYVLDGGINDFRKKEIARLTEKFGNISIEFITIDVDSVFKDFRFFSRFSLSVYSRFLIPQLKPNLDKAIYLDVDIIVLDDIAKLWNEDLDGYAIGAVPEYCCYNLRRKVKEKCCIAQDHKYFNSGVLVIDCKKWREQGIIQKLFDVEKDIRKELTSPDQDVLNKCFENNYKILDLKYNLQTLQIWHEYENSIEDEDGREILESVANALMHPVVRHFSGRNKPWTRKKVHKKRTPFFHEFWYFAKMTSFYDGMLAEFIDSPINSKGSWWYKIRKKLGIVKS